MPHHADRQPDPSRRTVPLFEYQAAPPHPTVADVVESVWTARGTIGYGRERILPTPRPVLIVNLGSPFRVRAANAGPGDDLRRSGWLLGPQTSYVANEPLAETDVVGAVLRPWGPAQLFDLAAHEVTDRIVDLDLIWGPDLVLLREQLATTTDPRRRRWTLTRALSARRQLGPPRPIRYATQGLADGSLPNVGSATSALGISRKHLNHLFDRYVGLAPRDYTRVHRFNRALQSLGSVHAPPLARVAHDHGYYDQSHLNRDFASFAAITPTEYLRRRAAHLTPDVDDSGLFVPGI